jgi:hypothetical protein
MAFDECMKSYHKCLWDVGFNIEHSSKIQQQFDKRRRYNCFALSNERDISDRGFNTGIIESRPMLQSELVRCLVRPIP